MSDFIEMFVEMFAMSSALQNENNELRKVLDKTIGAWFDENSDILDEVFLSTATGNWLDVFGKDFGVLRKIDESDEDYRDRIIFEKLEYLTAENLQKEFGLTLYSFINDFDVTDNQLASDNPYITTNYMSYADETLQKILNNKFVLGDSIKWL